MIFVFNMLNLLLISGWLVVFVFKTFPIIQTFVLHLRLPADWEVIELLKKKYLCRLES